MSEQPKEPTKTETVSQAPVVQQQTQPSPVKTEPDLKKDTQELKKTLSLTPQ